MSLIKRVIGLYQKHYSTQARRVKTWYQLDEKKNLRLHYGLDENSVVFDIGGYEGQWASDIYSMYNCSILIFEPRQDFAEKIEERFIKNKKIRTFRFGLSDQDATVEISLDDDSSSVIKKVKGNKTSIKLISVLKFIREQQITAIDLMKMNIEGGEYDLLFQLIKNDWVKNITNIQIQFHDFVPDAVAKMHEIQQLLERTHRKTYGVDFVWENWEKK